MDNELKKIIDSTNIVNFNKNVGEIIVKIIKDDLSSFEIKEIMKYVKETL